MSSDTPGEDEEFLLVDVPQPVVGKRGFSDLTSADVKLLLPSDRGCPEQAFLQLRDHIYSARHGYACGEDMYFEVVEPGPEGATVTAAAGKDLPTKKLKFTGSSTSTYFVDMVPLQPKAKSGEPEVTVASRVDTSKGRGNHAFCLKSVAEPHASAE